MTIDDKIRNEKLEYNKKIEAASSSGKIDKNEFFTVEKILSDRSRIIEQAKFTYSLLEKAFTTKNKNVWGARKKNLEATE